MADQHIEPADRLAAGLDAVNAGGDIESLYPLSHGQRALWFLHQLQPNDPTYIIARAIRIRTPLQSDAIQSVVQRLFDRHPALRTTFAVRDGQPMQCVHAHLSADYQEIDASAWSAADLDNRILEEAYRPFDLQRGPLLRITIYTYGPADHVMVVAVHHIICDLWSLTVLLFEFGVLLMAEINGAPLTLPPVSAQYADHIRAETEMLAGPEGERLRQFWRQQLRGELPVLNLVTDKPRPPVMAGLGAAESAFIAADVTDRLKALAGAHNTHLYTVLLAAFMVLLHHHTGQDDIIVGSPKAGREPRMGQVVGFFVNSVVMRGDLSGNPTFSAFLDQMSQTATASLANGSYPFALLVEKMQPARDLSRSPIYQAMFAWQKTSRLVASPGFASFALNQAGGQIIMGPLILESVALKRQVSPFDLTLLMTESDGGMAASLEYRSDLFEQDTIKRMCARFQALLAGIAQNPDCHLSDLPLLSDAERETILGQWNQTTAGDTEEHSAYALIEAQVEQSPHAVALISEQGELTYRELNATANRLAHYLREIGISAGSVAGLYVERGPEIVYGLLGLWKAGLTYLPLDTAQPQQRLAYMLSDAHAAVVLTQQRLLPRLPAGVRAVCLDSDWSAVAQCSPENPALTGSGDDIAYIMYTSGSTGRPKGVMVSQRAFANHCRDVQRCFQLSAADRVLQFTGVNFDPSLEQIAPTLMTGATIVLRGEQLWNPGDFHDKITRYGVTVANVPPAYWQQIVQEWPRNEGPERSTSLRLMIIGGDVVPPESLRIWQQTSLRRTRVLNAYGPTEAVITAAAYDIPADAGRHTARIPIGRPLPNRRAYILNKYGKPAPIGVAGELYLGGDRLAVGYLNDPEATAARFIADPFGPAGSRLYATGDLARYRADGNIEFLERADQQVKIRGMRVELGEIEAVLARHPDVRAVVVLAQADAERAGDKELVAYVTAHKDKTVAADEVRSFARAYLPDYMTPATIIVLDAFPLTASGKIDRRALPKPGIAQRARTQQYVAPRTPVEEQIAALWSQLLGVPQIGINDNFFELGGHSLLATQLVSRVRAMFQVEVSLLSLFESPTIAGVTLAIAQEQIKHLEMSAADELLNKLDQISDEDARRMSTGGSSV